MLFTPFLFFPLLFTAPVARNGGSLIENAAYLGHKSVIFCLFSQIT